jgi:DNA-binding transcriptional MerR regulator
VDIEPTAPELPDAEMRLDALAAAAGVATTTIRLYQQRGLLPGPRIEGRTGWYDRSHLARLRLIARLQEEGFSLAGIGKLLEGWDQGRDLTDLVDVEVQLDAILHRRVDLVVGPVELAERFPAEALTPELLARAMGAGLVEPTDDGRFRVLDRRFLDIGSELARMGVPLDVVLDEWDHLRAHTDEVAERFVSVFQDHLLPEGWREGLSGERATELARTLARLQHHAGQVLLAALDASMGEVARHRLVEVLGDDG